MMNAANDELQETVTALLDQFAPPAVPATPIIGLDYFLDDTGMFVTVTLADNSEIYVAADFGSPLTFCHVPAPKPTRRARHLFCVRNTAE